MIFPSNIFGKIDLLEVQQIPRRDMDLSTWDELFKKLDHFRKSGLDFIAETIPSWHVDRFNINKIMDVTYQRILSIFLQKSPYSRMQSCYGRLRNSPTLKRFLNFLEKQGAKIILTSKADINYLEAKVASLISKRMREDVIKGINENPEFMVDGLSVGTGNARDSQTIDWLKKWHVSGREWPWFIKRSFRTVIEIEGKQGKLKISSTSKRRVVIKGVP